MSLNPVSFKGIHCWPKMELTNGECYVKYVHFFQILFTYSSIDSIPHFIDNIDLVEANVQGLLELVEASLNDVNSPSQNSMGRSWCSFR